MFIGNENRKNDIVSNEILLLQYFRQVNKVFNVLILLLPTRNSRRDKVLTVDPSVDYAKVKNVSPKTWFTLLEN